MQLFKQHEEHRIIDPWTQIPLTPTQYQRFSDQLKQHPELWGYAEDKIRYAAPSTRLIKSEITNGQRYDYDPVSMLLAVRMPSTIHECFLEDVKDEIKSQLKAISHGGDSSAEFAAQIRSLGSARIFLMGEEDNLDRDGQVIAVFPQREPDGEFTHLNANYPGVVLEVSYAEHGKNLKKLAWQYIQSSNGNIKVVIGFDIKYGNTKEATLSIWRPRYIHEDGQELETLEVEETIVSEVCYIIHGNGAETNLAKQFRAPDGSVTNPVNVLCLSLDDFATDEISTKIDLRTSTKVNITYEALAQFLNNAEKMQELQQRRSGVESKRKTLKRERSSSPVDQLRSEDEAEQQDREKDAEERIEAMDGDFDPETLPETPVEPHDEQPRRSTRLKLRET